MDSARTSQLISPQSMSTSAHTTLNLPTSTSPTPSVRAKRHSEPPPSRQQKLLQTRNAKFSTKKLSIPSLSSRFSQLIHANDEPQDTIVPARDQENSSLKSQKQRTLKRGSRSTSSLGILDELSNTNLNRRPRASGEITIYQDTPERPLLDRSPFSSPALYQENSSQIGSPLEFDHIQDSLGNMRLREISGNEYRSSHLNSSPLHGSIQAVRKRKSFPVKTGFDTQEYIEHIEKELHEARNEMYSPTTNKSLKDQLHTARLENEKLESDMADMRDMFEAEVKRTVERRVEMEVMFKRRVKDLEDELDLKASIIQNLEVEHEEKRLDNNTVDTLKAAIERLEQDKLSLEDENRSISKRNEVLSELLAMSPTKSSSFELRSPTRERRGAGRPMSMIIPRLPSSPSGRLISQPPSAIGSPSVSISGSFYQQFRSRPGSPNSSIHGLGIHDNQRLGDLDLEPQRVEQDYFGQHNVSKQMSRRSTIQSQASIPDTASVVSNAPSYSETANHRVIPKRKPRKFMTGSTQLKPLLLPTLTGDGAPLSSSSAVSSPQVGSARHFSQSSIDPTTSFLSKAFESSLDDETVQSEESILRSIVSDCGTNSNHQTLEDIMMEHETARSVEHSLNTRKEIDMSSESSLLEDTVLEPPEHMLQNLDAYDDQTMQNTGYFIEPLSQPVMPGGDNVSFTGSPQMMSEPRGLNLRAVHELKLPEPEYDAFPDACSGTDRNSPTAIPQPLFSIRALPQSQPQTTDYEDVCNGHGIVAHHGRSQMLHARQDSEISHFKAQTLSNPDFNRQPNFPTRSEQRQLSLQNNENALDVQYESPQQITTKKPAASTKPQNPIDLLRSGRFGARPLAALTIRTIFGTISRCTGHVYDFKRDPLALARRVIANAWFSNWTKFGRLSWWVLGLFISGGLGGPKLREWRWDDYDAEAIAQRACQTSIDETASRSHQSSTSAGHCRLQNSGETNVASSMIERRPGWGKSLMLWGKFSIAIMLAVGGAVVRGPGEMLKEIDGSSKPYVNHGDRPNESLNAGSNRIRPAQNSFNSHPERPDRRAYTDQSNERLSQIKPATTSVPLHHSLHNPPGDTIQPLSQHKHSMSFPVCDGEDETVRALRSPRKHVAGVFYRETVNHSKNDNTTIELFSNDESEGLESDTESIDSGIVQWPPSPSRVYPEYRVHATNRHNYQSPANRSRCV